MKLNEVNTPKVKRQMYVYMSNHNDITLKNKTVQHLFDCWYIQNDRRGNCDIYCMHDEDKAGYWTRRVGSDWEIPEESEFTLDMLIEKVKEKIKNDVYFNKLEIAYVGQFRPDLKGAMFVSRDNAEIRIREEEKRKAEEKEREERKKIRLENAKSKKIIQEAIKKLKAKQEIKNEYIEVDGRGYMLFTYLFESNGINIPIKTKGFVNGNLQKIYYKDGTLYSHFRGGRGSQKFFDLYDELMRRI